MFETITKWFTQLAEKMTADQIGYTLLGALGLVFVVSLIVALASRERRKFRKGARRLIAAEGKNAAACIRTMPQAVVSAFNRAETLGGNPADFMSAEACVSVPYRVSAMSKLAFINFCSTVFLAVLGQSLVAYWDILATPINVTLLILICGAVLTFAAAIIGAVSYRNSMRDYTGFVAVLSRAYADRIPASVRPAPAAADAQFVPPAPAVQPAAYAPVAPQPAVTQPAAPAAYAAPQPAAPAAPYAEVRPVVPEEDVVARIDRISREGAPLSVMREVALLLQQERAKPENKTPEQQRRLNEALSKLLKAMSGNR